MSSTEFQRDLTAKRDAIDAARRQLAAALDAPADADLDRARRGGWSVRRVLEHLIQSEWLYSGLVSHLRDAPVPPRDAAAGAPASVAEARRALEASRSALLQALDGVDEARFYALRAVGHEEYSILSILENVASHDHEHAAQITATLEAS